jgi:fumarylacetoacetase
MAPSTNETHDPAMRSWVESANQPGCDFPIQNLPFGVFRAAPGGEARVGVACSPSTATRPRPRAPATRAR